MFKVKAVGEFVGGGGSFQAFQAQEDFFVVIAFQKTGAVVILGLGGKTGEKTR